MSCLRSISTLRVYPLPPLLWLNKRHPIKFNFKFISNQFEFCKSSVYFSKCGVELQNQRMLCFRFHEILAF